MAVSARGSTRICVGVLISTHTHTHTHTLTVLVFELSDPLETLVVDDRESY